MTEALRPVMTVIAGPNGSGKTTLAKKLLGHGWTRGAAYINADEIARDRFGDWNSPQAVVQAAEYADELRTTFLENGENFAYETVFSTQKRIDDLTRAQNAGFFIRFFFVATADPSINIARVIRRVQSGGHDVPKEKIVERYHRSVANLLRALRIADRAYVIDNSADDCDPQMLYRTVSGRIRRRYGDELPNWSNAAFSVLPRDDAAPGALSPGSGPS
ncbi:MAG: zeta toxin family protein [Geminicoccaceae bacterium]|nr:zeta toxin family protein [Geminicoccaceae bacterium]